MDIPAALAVLPQQFRFFAKKGLYKIPFLGSHLNRAGHLPVDRSNARNSLKSMTEGARVVAARGISMLLFPEGGRTAEGLRGFKEGAAYIAIKAGVPVVPMAIIGMRDCCRWVDALAQRQGDGAGRRSDSDNGNDSAQPRRTYGAVVWRRGVAGEVVPERRDQFPVWQAGESYRSAPKRPAMARPMSCPAR